MRERLIGSFSWKRVLRSLLLIPVFVYLGLSLIAWLFADSLLFRPQPTPFKDNSATIKLKKTNGETISAKFYVNDSAAYTIMFSHGNAEDIGTIEPFVLKLRNAGFSVFVYDYEGYGTSTGKPSEANTYADINAAFRYLVNNRNIPADRIILHGRSLGGGPSVDLAAREPVAGLILESTFTSASRVLTRYRILPFDRFENIDKLPSAACPVLIIHGKLDATIPFHHGEELLSVVKGPKSSLWIDNAGHNNVLNAAGETYLSAIQSFAQSLSK